MIQSLESYFTGQVGFRLLFYFLNYWIKLSVCSREQMKIKWKREAILLHLKLKGCNYLEKTVKKKKKASLTSSGVFGTGVQSSCQESIDVADGKLMQRVVKMRRKAKILHSRPHWPTPWVHLDHWSIAWMRRKQRVFIQKIKEKMCARSTIQTRKKKP